MAINFSFQVVFPLLVLCLIGYDFTHVCPKPELIKPCVCEVKSYGRDIRCEGNQTLDLVKIFENLSKELNETEKEFSVFHLANTAITELKDNTFKDITFDEIFIGYCTKLAQIHENAFNGTDLRAKYLSFYNNTALSSPDNMIYKIARKFTKLQRFELEYTNITEIPTNAFGSMEHLMDLEFGGPSLKKISPQAFYNLSQLAEISFEQVNITQFPDNTFQFESHYNWTFLIEFSNSPAVTSTVFTGKTFADMKRPVTLRFGSAKFPKQITYLDEKVFWPFLLENDKNSIDLNGEEFDCNDCRNKWLKVNQKAFNKIGYLKCSDKKPFNDTTHFKNCTSFN